jgi:hypothetical protein
MDSENGHLVDRIVRKRSGGMTMMRIMQRKVWNGDLEQCSKGEVRGGEEEEGEGGGKRW